MGKHHNDGRRAKAIAAGIGLVAVVITATTFTASQAAQDDRATPAQATETLRQKASTRPRTRSSSPPTAR
jgi:streptogrisin D